MLVEDGVCENLVIHLIIESVLDFCGIATEPNGTGRSPRSPVNHVVQLKKVSVSTRRLKIMQGKRLGVNKFIHAIEDMDVHPDVFDISGDVLDPGFHQQQGPQLSAYWWTQRTK